MKKLLVMTALLSVIGWATAEAQTPKEKEVVVGINDAYIPGGLDSNSDAYVVTNGIFPNGCYRWKRAEVDHPTTYNHEITTVASVSQGMCLMVLVPFTREVRIGKLLPGEHVLKFKNGDGTYLEKKLVIEE